ncbi:hypothetical protein PIB30_081513 [Stylosanthes scabra]|uniref:Putative plant transposon protein domain-containing protein n=1 Tax=Stylosanthes scabra TaxID=79078 RepID=A0ABU6WRE7_9FABA|nr:hypothetical protein [Stylosanthes scabra]
MLYHEAHFNSKLSARRILPELILQADENVFNPIRFQIHQRKWEKFTKPIQAIGHLTVKEFYANAWEQTKQKGNHSLTLQWKANKDRLDHILYDMCEEGAEWVRHRDGRPHYLRRSDLEPMTKGWYEFVCRSILPTTNRYELTVKRAMLIHSIIIGENINVEEIIAEQIYKFVYKADISSSLPFPSIIAALSADARIPAIPDDTLIPQEPPIIAEAMARTRESRAKNPRQTRQATPPQQQPQLQHQQDFSSGFYTHFDTSMSQVYRRLDQQQEENRRSFEAINTRMDKMDDQLSFLCYSNQMANEQMLSPYQNTARQFKEMEMQGIPVIMANLAIHRQREEEINQERMRYNQILQEVVAQQAREANKGKTREVVPDSEVEFVSSESEEF